MLFPGYFRNLTFPCIFHRFHTISTLFPPYFQVISRLFPTSHFFLHFSIVSTLFPPYFHLISRLFPSYFQNLTFPCIFPWFSPYFHLISMLFPSYFQIIFKISLFAITFLVFTLLFLPYFQVIPKSKNFLFFSMECTYFQVISKYVQLAFQLICSFSIKQPKPAREATNAWYAF